MENEKVNKVEYYKYLKEGEISDIIHSYFFYFRMIYLALITYIPTSNPVRLKFLEASLVFPAFFSLSDIYKRLETELLNNPIEHNEKLYNIITIDMLEIEYLLFNRQNFLENYYNFNEEAFMKDYLKIKEKKTDLKLPEKLSNAELAVIKQYYKTRGENPIDLKVSYNELSSSSKELFLNAQVKPLTDGYFNYGTLETFHKAVLALFNKDKKKINDLFSQRKLNTIITTTAHAQDNRNAVTNQTEPIWWQSSDRLLGYLLEELSKAGFIDKNSNFNKLIKDHFVNKDKKTFTDSIAQNRSGTGNNKDSKPKGHNEIDTVIKDLKQLPE
jgi:hypothetical protein